MNIHGIKGGKSFHKQMMRHMLSTFLLWYISKHKTYGYELIKTMEAEEGFRVMTASQIYPILKDLTKRGLVSQDKEMQGRRARKVYHLTEKGRDALQSAKKHMRKSPLRREFLLEMVR